MIGDQLPALQILIPLLAAPVCVIIRHARAAWVIALIANGTAMLIAWQLLGEVRNGDVIRYAIGGWAAPTGIEYYIDTVNALLLVLVSSISFLALVYAWQSISQSVPVAKQYLFFAAWLLCLTGLTGIVITGDAFNVFVFLEISSLSTYMLIAFGTDRKALSASFRYLILGSVGASFILIGIGFLYAATGTLNMIDLAERVPETESPRAVLVAFTFLTIGLMVKAAIFPLHAWLANAYHYAPVAVTAFLAGTATKVSIYVLLRFFFSIFGERYSFGDLFLSSVLMPAAIGGFLLMSLVAIFQTDLRRMLAYSSVAQIGYIIAGLSLDTQSGVTAAMVHIVNHGIMKAALFMACGCILYRMGHTHAPSLNNLLRRMPLTVIAFIIAGAGLIGLPLTAGFISKYQLITALLADEQWTQTALILISSLMAVVYIGRAVEVMIFDRSAGVEPAGAVSGRPRSPDDDVHEAPLMMLIPLYVLILFSVYFGVYGEVTLKIASQAAAQLMGGL